MSIEIQPRNDTEARQFISNYPIPAPIYACLLHGALQGQNSPELTPGSYTKSVYPFISVLSPERSLRHAENEQKTKAGMDSLPQSSKPDYIQFAMPEVRPRLQTELSDRGCGMPALRFQTSKKERS